MQLLWPVCSHYKPIQWQSELPVFKRLIDLLQINLPSILTNSHTSLLCCTVKIVGFLLNLSCTNLQSDFLNNQNYLRPRFPFAWNRKSNVEFTISFHSLMRFMFELLFWVRFSAGRWFLCVCFSAASHTSHTTIIDCLKSLCAVAADLKIARSTRSLRHLAPTCVCYVVLKCILCIFLCHKKYKNKLKLDCSYSAQYFWWLIFLCGCHI